MIRGDVCHGPAAAHVRYQGCPVVVLAMIGVLMGCSPTICNGVVVVRRLQPPCHRCAAQHSHRNRSIAPLSRPHHCHIQHCRPHPSNAIFVDQHVCRLHVGANVATASATAPFRTHPVQARACASAAVVVRAHRSFAPVCTVLPRTVCLACMRACSVLQGGNS